MENRNTQLFWQGYAEAVREMNTGNYKPSVKGQMNPTYYGVGYRTAVADLSNGVNRL